MSIASLTGQGSKFHQDEWGVNHETKWDVREVGGKKYVSITTSTCSPRIPGKQPTGRIEDHIRYTDGICQTYVHVYRIDNDVAKLISDDCHSELCSCQANFPCDDRHKILDDLDVNNFMTSDIMTISTSGATFDGVQYPARVTFASFDSSGMIINSQYFGTVGVW